MSPITQERRFAKVSLLITVAMIGVVGVSMMLGSASAQTDPYSNSSPTVIGTKIQSANPPLPTVLPTRETSIPPPEVLPRRTSLPLTGADISLYLATGVALVGTGSWVLRRNRRRS